MQDGNGKKSFANFGVAFLLKRMIHKGVDDYFGKDLAI